MYYLFDLDGTLTLPEQGITNSIRYALQKMNIDDTDPQKLIACIGPPLIESFKKYWQMNDNDAQKALGFYREYFSDKGMFENKLYDGIPELLQKLHIAGHKVMLATSKPIEYAIPILKHFGIYGYFTDFGANDFAESRPKKKDVIAFLLEKYPDMNKNNTLMVGDRKYDVIGAAACGINCVGVLYGYGTKQELLAAGAEYIAKDIKELTDLLLAKKEK